jgi:hypothetical protein
LVIIFPFKSKKQLVPALGLPLELIHNHSCSNTSPAAMLTSQARQLQFQLTQETSAQGKLENFPGTVWVFSHHPALATRAELPTKHINPLISLCAMLCSPRLLPPTALLTN